MNCAVCDVLQYRLDLDRRTLINAINRNCHRPLGFDKAFLSIGVAALEGGAALEGEWTRVSGMRPAYGPLAQACEAFEESRRKVRGYAIAHSCDESASGIFLDVFVKRRRRFSLAELLPNSGEGAEYLDVGVNHKSETAS
jgi:hypothetical protein